MRGAAEPPLFSALTVAAHGERLIGSEGDGDVTLYRGWLARDRAEALLASIRASTAWQQERRKMYDRFVDVPREQAWFGDDRDRPFTPELLAVRNELQTLTGARFVYVLLNRYRDGRDSVAWHSDREVQGLAHPVIASLTLGATRAFDLRPKRARTDIVSIDLDHGDLLVMRGGTQTHWEHRIRKDARIGSERINLTFRQQPA
ncbi:MAG: alpha-ketoglutarate-dependent dioxygenase AlkB [Candidatus Eremiobacteraeota bacterium]|nr:alpha-ketoglutarate-dependent dioxygenase AlkB [Candidatus Eremiobacteraeota bacterium]MBC5803554.1 alpha-ketoglutarate-dependent dioxygenase AlkB [Candidatus Eremiobacteraeota bacterium]MBC5822381.1 alpha-ketoglutarate-dependent dioxygenase AlkB [Candidatus Eremiobacteraeota bacterium]